MYARIVQSAAATDIDGGVAFVRDTVVPLAREQHGYRGLAVSADRAATLFGVVSLWTERADLEASDSAMAKVRAEGQQIIGGELTVEAFEEVVFEVTQPPTVGTSLLVRRLTMDPAMVDDNIAFFRDTILPQIKATSGFRGVRQLVNRETGSAIVATLWDDAAAMDQAAVEAQARQAQAAGRVRFGDQTRREILFIDQL
jgi:heme-degrading monooxygenase HmoA